MTEAVPILKNSPEETEEKSTGLTELIVVPFTNPPTLLNVPETVFDCEILFVITNVVSVILKVVKGEIVTLLKSAVNFQYLSVFTSDIPEPGIIEVDPELKASTVKVHNPNPEVLRL
jgi:hypothetical protein